MPKQQPKIIKAAAATRPSQSYLFAEKAAKIREIEVSFDLGDPMSPEERRAARPLIADMPDVRVESIAEYAARNGGVVCGVPFDADAARTTIAYVAASRAFVRTLRAFAQHVEDNAMGRSKEVALRTRAALKAMQATGLLPGQKEVALAAAEIAKLGSKRAHRSTKAAAAKKAAKKQQQQAAETPAAQTTAPAQQPPAPQAPAPKAAEAPAATPKEGAQPVA